LVAGSENDDDDKKIKTEIKARNNALLLNKVSSLQKPKAPLANLTLNLKNDASKPPIAENFKQSSSMELITTKIMLKDLRLPLVWKWNDHLKAIKNSENSTAKFATFAIIHLGNMIYDTHLISNIDPSTTDISFNETFIL